MAIQKRKLADGSCHYRARVFLGVVGGKRQEMFETFRTRKEAERWEREHGTAKDKGVLLVPSDRRLADHLRKWLDTAPFRAKVRARTLRDYERDLSRAGLLPPEEGRKVPRIASPLAHVPLNRLTTQDLETFYVTLATVGMPQKGCKPLGERSVRFIHTMIHAALGWAVKGKLVAYNAADGAELPKDQASTADNTVDSERDQQRMQVLTAEQVNRLLETSALPPPVREGERKGGRGKWRYAPPGDRNRFHALWHVLAKGGLRPNEALGLTWRDVEWDRSAIRVCRTLVRGFGRGVWKCEEPKTKTRRLVTLSADTMEALRQHRDQQTADLATMTQAEQARHRDHGFVFAGRNGEPLDIKNITTRHFVPLLAAAGLPRIRVYDLRHTHATLLLSANVPVRVVSERLGHKNAKMTLDVYAHVLPGQQEEAVERMEEYLSAVK